MGMTQPGGGSLQRRAVEGRAVAWLAARRGLIDPGNAGPDGVLFARKALIETAFLVGLRARLDPDPLDGDYTALLDQVQDITARPSYRELVARDEAALLLYAGTYAALRLCGREDPQFRRAIEQVAAGGYATVFERIPYRQLDLLHTLQLCDIEHSLPALDDVLPFTLLCNSPNVIKLTDRDIYAITHTIFYATDFGLRVPRWPCGFDPGEAVELLEALLVLTRVRGNADLVGELLCCLRCLGVRDSEEADRAWDFLASVQEVDGRVDGPRGVVHPKLADGDEEYQCWATGYHTTIVAALAALLDRSPKTVCGPRPAMPEVRIDLEVPIRRAVVWLADASMRYGPVRGLPAAAAASYAATAVGEPDLATPALLHFAKVLADANPNVWQECGMEVVGEFAVGLRTRGITCTSLDSFLKSTATAIGRLETVPSQAVRGVRRLADLGLIPPQRAAALTAEAARTGQAAPETAAARLPGAWSQYHLGHIASITRELAHAGWASHRITRDAIAFLLAQQSNDGAFGHPASDNPADHEHARLTWTHSTLTALTTATSLPAHRTAAAPRRPAPPMIGRLIAREPAWNEL
ncbi:DUF6895 family protein [Streptomyces silvisoli]|uniref:DUF6895 domain-containing protein n=1 Tax=Streptomyces silvisoli TaxID=3034235 RepID=A0ABT5ZP21_9ACTN|nr:hypothetical protein [Streptomyces silvisoli]MDF3291547.1 hypothetical protein [Streptomyces silvisoli]